MPERFARAAALIEQAVARRDTPAAAIEVGTASGVLWQHAHGTLSYEPGAAPATPDTVFDLASLTKVLATTPLAMRLVEQGRLGLHDRVARWVPAWRGQDRAHVTVRDLLEHCGGLTAWAPLYERYTGPAELVQAICDLPLEYPPWTRSVYSDLGFILLAAVIERAADRTLRELHEALTRELAIENLCFTPPASWKPVTAPTEVDPWRGRLLIGEVHDENAWALGGVAGHAGLFGTIRAVGAFARVLLATFADRTPLGHPETIRRFVTRSTVPGSSRALGWDTMLPTSSCGARLSRAAVGHTGFTGTSLWIDPAGGFYVALLSNRVHPTRGNEAWRAVRPRVHDAVATALAAVRY